MIGAHLVRESPNNQDLSSHLDRVGMEQGTDVYRITGMAGVERILKDTPRLAYIPVRSRERLDVDSIRRQPPLVHLHEGYKSLVDRGVKILVELAEGGTLEFETCV